MKKGIVFLILTLFFLLLPSVSVAICITSEDCPEGQICRFGTCIESRVLEIVYPTLPCNPPTIPCVPTPTSTKTALPVYINYIFRFSVIFIGILIFGVLIYNGVRYLTSFGNSTKLSDARKGMSAALLGGFILLCSVLIFNTINPQLLIIEPAPIGVLVPVIQPGVYLCNYETDIDLILTKYTSDSTTARLEAVQYFREMVGTPKSEKQCFMVNASGNLRDINIGSGAQYNVFIVPREGGTPENPQWVYEYGIVFHEKKDFGGFCRVLPTPRETGEHNQEFYRQLPDFQPNITFKARSITIFKKIGISTTTYETGEGVVLYADLNFNQETPTTTFPFKPSGNAELYRVTPDKLNEKKLKHNTKSIKFDPPYGYLAVLFGGDKETDEYSKCEVRWKDDTNLTDNPIGRCGNGCSFIGNIFSNECYSCLKEMLVIKGQGL